MDNSIAVSEYQLSTQPLRRRGLLSQISTVLFRPAMFFRTLQSMADTRQWLWIGLLILAVIGFTAVRYLDVEDSGASASPEPGMPMDFGVPGDMGGPGDFMPPPGAGGSSPSNTMNTTERWETGLIAAAGLVLIWAVQSVLLSEVSMLNGKAPSLGYNLQITIWASLPLALMAVVQLVFLAAGGSPGEPGLSGLVRETALYECSSDFVQSLLLSFTRNLTLFWLWSMMLIYFGGRYALRGKSWAVLLVIVSWTIILTIAPVLSGHIDASEANIDHTERMLPGEQFGSDELIPQMDQFPDEMLPPSEQRPDEISPEGEASIDRPQMAPEAPSMPEESRDAPDEGREADESYSQ